MTQTQKDGRTCESKAVYCSGKIRKKSYNLSILAEERMLVDVNNDEPNRNSETSSIYMRESDKAG